jgi:hypothetical protein
MSQTFCRREFLEWGVSGTAILVAGSMGGGCAGVCRADLPSSAKVGAPIAPDLKRMLHLASLAPSSHNTQPWRVHVIDGTHLGLSIDPHRCLPVVDPKRREMSISMGAFVENLAHAASATRWCVETAQTAQSPAATPLCSLRLRPDDGNEKAVDLNLLQRRRTVRKNLTGEADAVAACTRLSAARGDALFVPMKSGLAEKIGRLTAEAFAAQTADDAAQTELADWIRLKNRDARQKRDGLTTESLEISGMAGWVVRTFMNRGSVTKESFRERGIAETRQRVAEGAGWFVLTSPTDSVTDCIDAGRRFERLALSCVPLGISLHPMSQALEYEDTRRALRDLLGIRERPQMLLRAGGVQGRLEPVSLRRRVSDFIV